MEIMRLFPFTFAFHLRYGLNNAFKLFFVTLVEKPKGTVNMCAEKSEETKHTFPDK